MKRRICSLLYSLSSWLADRTGGFKPVVRWKLLLGTLLVGGIATSQSCTGGKAPETVPADTVQVTCYMPAPPDDDSLMNSSAVPPPPPPTEDAVEVNCPLPVSPADKQSE